MAGHEKRVGPEPAMVALGEGEFALGLKLAAHLLLDETPPHLHLGRGLDASGREELGRAAGEVLRRQRWGDVGRRGKPRVGMGVWGVMWPEVVRHGKSSSS